jgi:hypothetical protein
MTEAKVPKPRKKPSIAEQRAAIIKDEQKLADRKAKLAVEVLKDFITNLKVANVGSIFSVVRANHAGVKDIDILRTLAEIAKLKVNITEKPVVTRAKKGESKKSETKK